MKVIRLLLAVAQLALYVDIKFGYVHERVY
jgi:hypothetical protein